MANKKGLELLRRTNVRATEAFSTTVLITEGVPDFLTWATHTDAYVTFGIIAGSWIRGFAECIPPDVRVLIRTHDDDAGHKYAQRIGETLRDRCQVFCRAKK